MKAFIICLLLCSSLTGLSQKPPITNSTYRSWDMIMNYNISDNGQYVWYTYGSELTGMTLVLTNISRSYKKIFTDVRDAAFTPGGQYLLFTSHRGVGIIQNGKDSVQYIQADQFETSTNGNGRWIKMQRGDTLLIRDLVNNKELSYPRSFVSFFSADGTSLLIKSKDSLTWLHLMNGNSKTILVKPNINNITFNNDYSGMSCTAGPLSATGIYYFKMGMDSALLLAGNHSTHITPGLRPAPAPLMFSKDNSRLFFKLTTIATAPHKQQEGITDKLKIWDYRDNRLAAESVAMIEQAFTAAIPVGGGTVIQIENTDSSMLGLSGNQYVLLQPNTVEEDAFWNQQQIPGYDLLSLKDGQRRTIIRSPRQVSNIALSPTERYVIWFDQTTQHYYSYEISSGVTRNITSAVQTSLVNQQISRMEILPYGIAGWMADDARLLLYDEFDIWMIDPIAKQPPVNITNNYGHDHRICFRVVYPQQLTSLSIGGTLLIAALDSARNNGLTFIKANQQQHIVLPDMQPGILYFPGIAATEPAAPIKAGRSSAYLLTQQSADKAPNLVTTGDFKTFTPITDLRPQQAYNWLTASLIHWNMPDGSEGTGILYMPEDVDSSRKYPLIFHYYEERSKGLHLFPGVQPGSGEMNIAWYVSNGYLVFVPDIHRHTGDSGHAILNTITSAALYLSTLRYIDTSRMGLQGHSFGGYETNYLITHTNIFAAAQASAAPAELFGLHGSTGFGGKSYHYISERGQLNVGSPPWEKPDIYLQSSPLISVNKVTTPLLLMHNREDGAVPFSQSVAMFTALRRLKKPVWLLEYEGEGHVLFDPACQLDFNIRQQAFFGYYLMGKEMPQWMKHTTP